MRLPGSEQMSDEMEKARLDMVIGGIEDENITLLFQRKFDHYTRLNIDIELKNDAYKSLIHQIAPYVELPSEEDELLTKEEQDKEFIKTWASIDWKEVAKQLPTPANES